MTLKLGLNLGKLVYADYACIIHDLNSAEFVWNASQREFIMSAAIFDSMTYFHPCGLSPSIILVMSTSHVLSGNQSGDKFVVKVRISDSSGARIYIEHFIFKLPNEEVCYHQTGKFSNSSKGFGIFLSNLMVCCAAYCGGKGHSSLAWQKLSSCSYTSRVQIKIGSIPSPWCI